MTPIRTTLALVALTAGMAMPAPVLADDALRPAVDARQAQFTLLAFNLSVVGQMAQGRIAYDAEAAQIAADNMAAIASLHQGRHFPAGSDRASMEGTRALPAIWDTPDDFAERFEALRSATAALQTAASVDLASLQGAVRGVAGACQACHQNYRGD